MKDMRTHNEILVEAPLDPCFEAASDVERWPEILSHYRRVVFTRQDGGGGGRVRMEAVRRFGPLPWPVWWESEMRSDRPAGEIHYRHVGGITRGMEVTWRLEPDGAATRVVITHDWAGPGWPLIGRFAARRVIGPRFVRVVAGRTLAGIKRAVERPAEARTRDGTDPIPGRRGTA